MIAISLGWGVQSFTLAAMSALGDLPPVGVAIHADTTHERSDTYAFATKYTPWLESHGVRVATVRDETAAERVWHGEMIPAYTTDGQALRTCTQRWKIAPIRRWLQANRNGEPVELWMGISLDEATRMKRSDVQYVTHRWPLIERLMRRADCEAWLAEHGLDVPPKSACVFCPYHSDFAWRELRDAGSIDWHTAVAVDEAVRNARPDAGALYLTDQRVPLAEADLSTPQERGQLDMFNEECSGVCGV